jgi:ketosteroid isomerase-like protein
MKMKKILFFSLVAVMMIAACQPKTKTASVDIRVDVDSIRNLEDQWSMAIQASDVNKIVSFYSSDAVNMGANKPIAAGLEAIRKTEESSFSDTTYLYKSYSSTIDNIEVSASGDLAYARGSDRVSQKTPKGPNTEVGKWIDIWKKVDGNWKVVASIWNSDKPLPK